MRNHGRSNTGRDIDGRDPATGTNSGLKVPLAAIAFCALLLLALIALAVVNS